MSKLPVIFGTCALAVSYFFMPWVAAFITLSGFDILKVNINLSSRLEQGYDVGFIVTIALPIVVIIMAVLSLGLPRMYMPVAILGATIALLPLYTIYRYTSNLTGQSLIGIPLTGLSSVILSAAYLVQYFLDRHDSTPARNAPQTDKDKMIQAREFIEAKEYQKARSLLRTIDHPKATEWLRKLDNMNV